LYGEHAVAPRRKPDPIVEIRTITPAQAAEWLEHNFSGNRKMQEPLIQEYAADMKAGRWTLNDQGISFNTRHELVNGQKRLAACIRANVPFVSLVVWNLPDKSVLVIDGQQRRSTDDNFRMAGLDFPRGVGATVRRLLLGTLTKWRPFSDPEVETFLRLYGDAVRLTHKALPGGKFSHASIRAPVARAAILGLGAGKLPQAPQLQPADVEGVLVRFGSVLGDGFMQPGEGAAVRLRNQVLEGGVGIKGWKYRLYALTETALVDFFKGREPKQLTPAANEQFPIPEEDSWRLGEFR
jgi:hypothetical protein